jgi:hypothetical protein
MSSIADPGSMDAGSLTEPDNETPATSTTATGIWLTSASVHSDGRDFSSLEMTLFSDVLEPARCDLQTGHKRISRTGGSCSMRERSLNGR